MQPDKGFDLPERHGLAAVACGILPGGPVIRLKSSRFDCGEAMAGTDTAPPRLRLCICRRNHALQMEMEMQISPRGLSDEKAARMMTALRELA